MEFRLQPAFPEPPKGGTPTWLRSLLKSIAITATTFTLSSSLLFAQEPLPITFRDNPQFVPSPISRSNVTFPSTSSAPIRWKLPGGARRVVSHIDDVEHTTGEPGMAAGSEDRVVQPVAFTLELDGPKNSGAAKGHTARQVQGKSVLSTRRAGPPAEAAASPGLLTVPPAEGAALDEDSLVPLNEDAFIPPQPEFDPDDAAPTPPSTLQPRATPQLTRQQRPEFRDPAEVAQPPVGGVRKERCSNPNDRDCCADEEICDDRLARIQADKLIRFGKEQLDITPRYMPNEKPDEVERNEERKRQQFTLAGSREWQDKSGRPLANGKLVDLALGNAIVETESGESVELSLRQLSDDDLCFIAAWYSLPTECTLGNEPYRGRQFIASTMTWKASALCHTPLYFEDVQLERYGHTRGPLVQPVVSGAHFFANVALLPYKMGINPPNECQYPLGYYRPGSCAPWMLQPFPLSARGAASAVGFYTGANYLIP